MSNATWLRQYAASGGRKEWQSDNRGSKRHGIYNWVLAVDSFGRCNSWHPWVVRFWR